MKFSIVQWLGARMHSCVGRPVQHTSLTVAQLNHMTHEHTWTAISLLRREESLRDMQAQNARQVLIDSAFDDLEDACSFAHWNMLECVIDIK